MNNLSSYEKVNGRPFVNTGRHPIALYDYLFDDASGKMGFRHG